MSLISTATPVIPSKDLVPLDGFAPVDSLDDQPVPSEAEVTELISKTYTLEYYAITNTTTWFNSTFKEIALQRAMDSRDLALALLQGEATDLAGHPGDTDARRAARTHVWKFVRAGVSGAYKRIKSVTMRHGFLLNINERVKPFLDSLEGCTTEQAEYVASQALAARNWITLTTVAESPVATCLANLLRLEGRPWDAVLLKYKAEIAAERGVTVEALSNDEEGMMAVYQQIVTKSGVPSDYAKLFGTASKFFSSAMMAVSFAMDVVEIIKSQHPGLVATLDVVKMVDSVATGEIVEQVVEPLVETGLVAADCTAESVALATFLIGTISGLVIGFVIDLAVTAIFEALVNVFKGNPIPAALTRVTAVVPTNSEYAQMLQQWITGP